MRKTGTILIYNCTGPKFSKLRQTFAMLGIRMRTVTPVRYHIPLIQLAAGEGEETPEPEQAFSENMLVFCQMDQSFLHQILEVIRLSKIPPIELKAALTETNQNWDSIQLHDELLKERDAIASQQKAAASDKQES